MENLSLVAASSFTFHHPPTLNYMTSHKDFQALQTFMGAARPDLAGVRLHDFTDIGFSLLCSNEKYQQTKT